MPERGRELRRSLGQRSRRPPPRAPAAYTLFEMVLVLAILLVMLAVAYPSLDALYGDFRVTGAADAVRAAWARARAQAVNEGRPYRFAFTLNRGNYRVAPAGSDYWGGAGGVSGAAEPPLILEEALPKGVRFCTPDTLAGPGLDAGADTALPPGSIAPGQWSGGVTFLPGRPAPAGPRAGLPTRG